jgi:branched-subunit amino acid aminotransferase/4-amino-4-deoxychorismate lyase
VPDLPLLELDGRPLTPDAWQVHTLGYGHFTAMQVRGGRTRGLDFHLHRLDAASRELFDQPLPGDLVRERIRHALDGLADASVRVFGYEGPTVLVTVRPPGEPPRSPQRLRAVAYQRPVAHIKHASGFAQTYHRRRAQSDGYDEILLTASDGTISEGGITNLGCFDGSSLVWPDAPALTGITMQVLRRELAARGVPSRSAPVTLADLPRYAAVFVTNARGIALVSQVDDVTLPTPDDVLKTLLDAYDAAPWDAI